MQQPKVILFDLYETLITEFTPEWHQIPSLSRLKLDAADFMAAWKTLVPRRMTGDIPDFPSALREIYQMLGEPPDDSAIEYLYQERLALKARPFEQIAPSILNMVKALAGMPIQLGIVSNAAPEETVGWDSCLLAPHFAHVWFSCDVGRQKPDAQIYQLACERFTDENPHLSLDDIWFVGDGGSDELTGAAHVGLTPYWATWFLDAWPEWKRSAKLREAAARFPRLVSPDAFVALVDQSAKSAQ